MSDCAISRFSGKEILPTAPFIKTEKLFFKAKLLPLLGKKMILDYVGGEGLAADIIKKDGAFDGHFLKEAASAKIGSGKIYFASPDIEIKASRIRYFGGEAV